MLEDHPPENIQDPIVNLHDIDVVTSPKRIMTMRIYLANLIINLHPFRQHDNAIRHDHHGVVQMDGMMDDHPHPLVVIIMVV